MVSDSNAAAPALAPKPRSEWRQRRLVAQAQGMSGRALLRHSEAARRSRVPEPSAITASALSRCRSPLSPHAKNHRGRRLTAPSGSRRRFVAPPDRPRSDRPFGSVDTSANRFTTSKRPESPAPCESDAPANGRVVPILVRAGRIQHDERNAPRGRANLAPQNVAVHPVGGEVGRVHHGGLDHDRHVSRQHRRHGRRGPGQRSGGVWMASSSTSASASSECSRPGGMETPPPARSSVATPWQSSRAAPRST